MTRARHAANPLRAETELLPPSILHYRAIIILSPLVASIFHLLFPPFFSSFSPRSLVAPSRARVWWLALLDKPLSPTRPRQPPTPGVFSYPLLPTHPSPCLTPPPLDSASPRRHATFDFHEKDDDDDAAASRKVPVEESPLLLCSAGSVFVHSTIVEVYCRP